MMADGTKEVTMSDSSSVVQTSSEDDVASGRESTASGPWIPFDKYKMDHSNTGYGLIINNREFRRHAKQDDEPLDPNEPKLEERLGTHMDNKRMIFLMKDDLGFKTLKKHHNLTKEKMIEAVKLAASADYSDMDCFMCVILTYGSNNGKIWASDQKVKLSDLIEPFKGKEGQTSKSLIGKPKIFIIQAIMDKEVLSHDALLEKKDETDKLVTELVQLPTEADFFIGFSSVPGSLNKKEGSWFIQSFYKVVKENYGKDDLVSMVTKTINKVSEYFNDNDDTRKKRMYPVMKSTLTKKVHFSAKAEQ